MNIRLGDGFFQNVRDLLGQRSVVELRSRPELAVMELR